MTYTTLSDFITLINNQVPQHENLNHLLMQIQYLIDFTASHNLEDINPLQLNAQFIAMEKLLQDAQALNTQLQNTLLAYQSTQASL